MGEPAATARIPADLLCWGRIERGTKSLSALRFQFERLLPMPIDAVHLTEAVDGDSIVFTAIRPERLRQHLAERTDVTPDTWCLVPDRLPEHHLTAGADVAVVERLNLFHGVFEPEPRRRLRRRARVTSLALIAVALVVAVVGVERHAAILRRHAQELVAERRALIEAAIPPAPDLPADPEARLIVESRRLGQGAHGASGVAVDADLLLGSLWRSWPKNLRVEAETITAAADRVLVRGRVPGLADAEALARACAAISVGEVSYRAEPVQAQQGPDAAQFLLTWTRGATP